MVRNVDEFLRLEPAQFDDTCHVLSDIYYEGPKPLLDVGQLIYGFFKYLITSFNPRHEIYQITQRNIVIKPKDGKRLLHIIGWCYYLFFGFFNMYIYINHKYVICQSYLLKHSEKYLGNLLGKSLM